MYLVVGSDGLIGRALLQEMKGRNLAVCSTTRNKSSESDSSFLDLSDSSSWKIPDGITAACIAAACTSLADCKREPVHTREINVDATIALTELLAQRGIFVLLLSTNLVFDGSAACPKAQDETNPQTEYGRQKAAMESAALKLAPEHAAILRLTRVISADDRLLSSWRERLERNESIDAFTDYYLAPVALSSVTRLISLILERRLLGICQLSAASEISYADFAQYLALRMNKPSELIRRTSYKDANLDLEHSPRYPTLDSSRLEHELGYKVSTPQAALETALKNIR